MVPIPQTNPRANYFAHKNQIDLAIHHVLNQGRYILGPEVSKFEEEFREYLHIKHAIGVANGTDAIELALRACQIGKNDYVATVSHTAVATVSAIERAGATPLFIDIDPKTYTISPESFKLLLKKSKRIKAVIAVHLYGHPADMPSILDLAREYDSSVIEDCAQAHGASLNGKKVGTWGDISTFSFYPTKNLGCLGDGGIVATNNSVFAKRVYEIREYGWKKRYVSSITGVNSRLDEIQAAILRVKLKFLDKENQQRHQIADLYTKGLRDLPIILPHIKKNALHVFHQYVIQCDNRDKIKKKLLKQGVNTLIHYPIPAHKQPAYQNRIHRIVSLENTEDIVSKILSLPMFPELDMRSLRHIINAIVSLIGS